MPKPPQKKQSAPAGKSLYTIKLTASQMESLASILEARNWEAYEVAYARFAFRCPQVNVVGYSSGKLVVQGKGTEEFVIHTLEPEVTREAAFGYDAVLHPEWYELHAGLDESGKGDVFGPLVVACVIADRPAIEAWVKAGVQDSKKINDSTIKKLAGMIRKTPDVVAESFTLSMPKYNELMSKPRANLNLLLAWQHAKNLEAALDRKLAPWGMLDQFSKAPLVQRYFKKHPSFDLKMQTKAEADPVVAAASIIARADYVAVMEKLSSSSGHQLLKGASSAVLNQAKAIFQEQGRDGLAAVAKMHFRTAYQAQGLNPPIKKNTSND